MRAVLTNFGTTGDAHPYLALAVELKRHGHQPVLGLPPFFAPLVARYGIDFFPIGPDLHQTQRDINESMIAAPTIAESATQMSTLFEPLAHALPQMYAELRAACQGADVLISGPMQPASRMIHELTGIPFVSVQVEHFGGGGTPAFQHVARELINPFRSQLGLPPLQQPLTSDANSPQLALYAMSRHVSPPPGEWPAHYHMTGYFFLNNDGWEPDAALVEFLADGPPPVVITFGSMTHDDPIALTSLCLDAVAQTGCRAILQQGWSGLGGLVLPPDVYMLGYCAYDWLFPQAGCVVHHGGPGTAAWVFRAGVPGVFVPHAWDQPIWAELAQGLGCSGPMIPFGALTAERLSAALTESLHTPRYQQAASALGTRISAEQGVAKARQLIEQLVARASMDLPRTSDDDDLDRTAQPRRRRNLRPRSHAYRTDPHLADDDEALIEI